MAEPSGPDVPGGAIVHSESASGVHRRARRRERLLRAYSGDGTGRQRFMPGRVAPGAVERAVRFPVPEARRCRR